MVWLIEMAFAAMCGCLPQEILFKVDHTLNLNHSIINGNQKSGLDKSS